MPSHGRSRAATAAPRRTEAGPASPSLSSSSSSPTSHLASSGPSCRSVAGARTDRRASHADAQPARKTPRSLIAGLVLLALALLFGTLPFTLMALNHAQAGREVSVHDAAVQALPDAETQEALAKAHRYNELLAQEGAAAMGEAVDPWGGGDQSVSETDEAYQGVLDTPDDGIMAAVSYPSLGIDLPIRHGTSNKVLAAGAGHMYGTSVPVGGASTNAVISAHTGYDRLMFDRLSMRQGKVGDFFYITVLGQTLGYRVREIQVIEPDDFSHFAILPGQDLVTLLTCTPYGVNTQRLIVVGERVDIPVPAPDPKDVPRSHPERWLLGGVLLAWLVFLTIVVLYLRRRRRRARQAQAEAGAGDPASGTTPSLTSGGSLPPRGGSAEQTSGGQAGRPQEPGSGDQVDAGSDEESTARDGNTPEGGEGDAGSR